MSKDEIVKNFFKDNKNIKNFKIQNLENKNYETCLVICTYNRVCVEYTFEYVAKSILDNCIIIVVDDNSSEKRIYELIDNFNIKNIPIIKILKKENKQINDSLRIGWNLGCQLGVKYLTNLDSDTLVKKDWLKQLKEMYEKLKPKYKDLILTGFNTKNHKIHKELEDHNLKLTVGGINIFMSSELYKNLKLHDSALNTKYWDWSLCSVILRNKFSIATLKKSVVQHIGFDGMHSNFKNKLADFANDFIYDEDDKFYFVPCLDSPGNDKQKVNGNIDQLKKFALQHNDIVGFNSNGVMKTHIILEPKKDNVNYYKDFKGIYIKKTHMNKVENKEKFVFFSEYYSNYY